MMENPQELDKPHKLAELEKTLQEVYDLRYAARVLEWDQWAMMPEAAANERARQLAAVRGVAHERFTDSKVGELLEELGPLEEAYPHNSYESSLVRVTRREYEREIRTPTELVRRFAENSAVSYAAWARAKREDRFEIAEPHLRRSLDLSLELSECLRNGGEHPADPLLAAADPGMNAQSISTVFAELRPVLVTMSRRLSGMPKPDDSFLNGQYPSHEKIAFSEEVVGRLGYDFSRGRQDIAESPFMSRLSANDVRVVSWDKRSDARRPLFASLHETGHALYEQGIPEQLNGTPLGEVDSASLHESQARLFENVVGLGRPFWEFFYPKLQRSFPGELGSISLDAFHRAVNRVEPSLIRTQADEVTYNLHAIMRFDFEIAMLGGTLDVGDLPEAWRERMQADLGVVPEGDRDGCLQDPHWYDEGVGGMFHGYALGNLISAQLWESALQQHASILGEMAQGEFGSLVGWLRENVWRHGDKLTAQEIVEKATGSQISTEPFVNYLRHKYGALYNLSL